MINEQILKKAIEKAEKNKFDLDKYLTALERDALKQGLEGVLINWQNRYWAIIFSHDFAKAFWGIEWKDGDVIETPMSEILAQENIKKWEHHLRQMILEKEPLKYLEKFLNK